MVPLGLSITTGRILSIVGLAKSNFIQNFRSKEMVTEAAPTFILKFDSGIVN